MSGKTLFTLGIFPERQEERLIEILQANKRIELQRERRSKLLSDGVYSTGSVSLESPAQTNRQDTVLSPTGYNHSSSKLSDTTISTSCFTHSMAGDMMLYPVTVMTPGLNSVPARKTNSLENQADITSNMSGIDNSLLGNTNTQFADSQLNSRNTQFAELKERLTSSCGQDDLCLGANMVTTIASMLESDAHLHNGINEIVIQPLATTSIPYSQSLDMNTSVDSSENLVIDETDHLHQGQDFQITEFQIVTDDQTQPSEIIIQDTDVLANNPTISYLLNNKPIGEILNHLEKSPEEDGPRKPSDSHTYYPSNIVQSVMLTDPETNKKTNVLRQGSRKEFELETESRGLSDFKTCVCTDVENRQEVPEDEMFIAQGQMYRLEGCMVVRIGHLEMHAFFRDKSLFVPKCLLFKLLDNHSEKVFRNALRKKHVMQKIITKDMCENDCELIRQKYNINTNCSSRVMFDLVSLRKIGQLQIETPLGISVLANNDYLMKNKFAKTRCSLCGARIFNSTVKDEYTAIDLESLEKNSRDGHPDHFVVGISVGVLAIRKEKLPSFQMKGITYISVKDLVNLSVFTLKYLKTKFTELRYRPISAPPEVLANLKEIYCITYNSLWVDLNIIIHLCESFDGVFKHFLHQELIDKALVFETRSDMFATDTSVSEDRFVISGRSCLISTVADSSYDGPDSFFISNKKRNYEKRNVIKSGVNNSVKAVEEKTTGVDKMKVRTKLKLVKLKTGCEYIVKDVEKLKAAASEGLLSSNKGSILLSTVFDPADETEVNDCFKVDDLDEKTSPAGPECLNPTSEEATTSHQLAVTPSCSSEVVNLNKTMETSIFNNQFIKQSPEKKQGINKYTDPTIEKLEANHNHGNTVSKSTIASPGREKTRTKSSIVGTDDDTNADKLDDNSTNTQNEKEIGVMDTKKCTGHQDQLDLSEANITMGITRECFNSSVGTLTNNNNSQFSVPIANSSVDITSNHTQTPKERDTIKSPVKLAFSIDKILNHPGISEKSKAPISKSNMPGGNEDKTESESPLPTPNQDRISCPYTSLSSKSKINKIANKINSRIAPMMSKESNTVPETNLNMLAFAAIATAEENLESEGDSFDDAQESVDNRSSRPVVTPADKKKEFEMKIKQFVEFRVQNGVIEVTRFLKGAETAFPELFKPYPDHPESLQRQKLFKQKVCQWVMGFVSKKKNGTIRATNIKRDSESRKTEKETNIDLAESTGQIGQSGDGNKCSKTSDSGRNTPNEFRHKYNQKKRKLRSASLLNKAQTKFVSKSKKRKIDSHLLNNSVQKNRLILKKRKLGEALTMRNDHNANPNKKSGLDNVQLESDLTTANELQDNVLPRKKRKSADKLSNSHENKSVDIHEKDNINNVINSVDSCSTNISDWKANYYEIHDENEVVPKKGRVAKSGSVQQPKSSDKIELEVQSIEFLYKDINDLKPCRKGKVVGKKSLLKNCKSLFSQKVDYTKEKRRTDLKGNIRVCLRKGSVKQRKKQSRRSPKAQSQTLGEDIGVGQNEMLQTENSPSRESVNLDSLTDSVQNKSIEHETELFQTECANRLIDQVTIKGLEQNCDINETKVKTNKKIPKHKKESPCGEKTGRLKKPRQTENVNDLVNEQITGINDKDSDIKVSKPKRRKNLMSIDEKKIPSIKIPKDSLKETCQTEGLNKTNEQVTGSRNIETDINRNKTKCRMKPLFKSRHKRQEGVKAKDNVTETIEDTNIATLKHPVSDGSQSDVNGVSPTGDNIISSGTEKYILPFRDSVKSSLRVKRKETLEQQVNNVLQSNRTVISPSGDNLLSRDNDLSPYLESVKSALRVPKKVTRSCMGGGISNPSENIISPTIDNDEHPLRDNVKSPQRGQGKVKRRFDCTSPLKDNVTLTSKDIDKSPLEESAIPRLKVQEKVTRSNNKVYCIERPKKTVKDGLVDKSNRASSNGPIKSLLTNKQDLSLEDNVISPLTDNNNTTVTSNSVKPLEIKSKITRSDKKVVDIEITDKVEGDNAVDKTADEVLDESVNSALYYKQFINKDSETLLKWKALQEPCFVVVKKLAFLENPTEFYGQNAQN